MRLLIFLAALLLAQPYAWAEDPLIGQTCGPANGTGDTCDGSGVASQGNTSDTNLGAGNPINVVNGNKYQQEVDLPAPPDVLGLEIVRHYNSGWNGLGATSHGWRLSYETRLC
jgi:hypothetical protein